MEKLILVDENDNETGTCEKLAAHEKALCHRAFSVFIFREVNGSLELLLQQRHLDKYHCGGLWTNTCCSHPRPGEEIIAAGRRRLLEEMGINLDLQHVGVFHYIARFDNGLTENEVDHVLVGFHDNQQITIDPVEISTYNWIALADLEVSLQKEENNYTPWFKQAYEIAKKGMV